MISLINLAHRASEIHGKFSGIHSSAFSFSFKRLATRSHASQSEFCEFERQLQVLCGELEQVNATIHDGTDLDLSTTLNREFAGALGEYVEALQDSASKLSHICARMCRDDKGIDSYSEIESRDDRIRYDDSVLQYQRLGSRLSQLFELL